MQDYNYDKKEIVKKAEKILQECSKNYEKKESYNQVKCKQLIKLKKENKRLKKINFLIVLSSIAINFFIAFLF